MAKDNVLQTTLKDSGYQKMAVEKWQIGVGISVTVAAIAISLNSCVTIPKGAVAVSPFNKARYLDIWYEIARMDFRFEKNLSNVSATYTLNPHGTIRVDNEGYDYVDNKWKESIGKAKLLALI